MLDVSLFVLLDTFRSVITQLPTDVKEIVYQEIPIEEKIRDILDYLEGRKHTTFKDILLRESTRHGVIVCFLAILELIRLKQIIAKQNGLFDEIRIYRVREQDAAIAETAEGIEQENGNNTSQENN